MSDAEDSSATSIHVALEHTWYPRHLTKSHHVPQPWHCLFFLSFFAFLRWSSTTTNARRTNILHIYTKRETIESKIIDYNTSHFKKTLDTQIVKNKIYERLNNDEIQNKILTRQLERYEYDNDKVFEYLKLLKQLEIMNTTDFELISLEEW